MAKKQKTQQEDEDLVMTIASDEELSNAEESSDSENSEDEAATQQQQEQINEDFEFDEGGAFHSSGGSSWDFTAAISRIEKMESGIPTATKRTSIQAKIDKRRKEKEDEKKSKKKKVKKEKKQEESGSEEDSVDEKGEEASEAEDENSDDEKEESYSESESSKDGNEQVDEEEDVVVEEESLQSALKDSKKDQQTREGLVDEMEKKKAAEFFEADPFAAQEFAKTKFETFADLKLSRPIMRAISHIGFEKPTPIQLLTLTSESRRLVMKQVSRHCQGFVKSRAVPDPVIAQWKARIESMQEDVKLVMHEETLEKRMREAEKEATRATNLLKHRDEINARPARTWFMSEKEKKNVNERADEDRRAKEEAAKEEAQSADPMSRAKKLKLMSHKKRRLFEIREREERMLADAAQDEEEDTGKKGKKGPVFTSMHVAGAAKHAKKAQQETTRSREEESIAEMHERKRLKREKARATRSSHGSGAFDVDMTSDGAPAPKPRKQRDANAGNNPFEFKEKITDYKKHAKKGSSSFKSKAKYKRRK
ncbi:hypothetical protein PC119_g12209 [Phytophthora cactorum]|nr:hypothetical protein PC119_g12209 [Phytophthora cactorum]